MTFAPDRATHRRDTFSFGICVVLSVLGLFNPGAGDAITAAIRGTVLVPALWLQQAAEQGRTSRARFLAVMAERDSAALAARSLNVLTSENRQLRGLLGLGNRLGTAYIAAEVLHQPVPTDGRTLVLSAGSRQGVRVYSPVLSAEGLVGVVRSVQPNWSVAMTWAHPEFRAGAFTEDGSIFGIVAPANAATASETLLELRGVPYRDSIAPGIKVVASGLGGVLPAGVPIGTVMGVLREERGWERAYLLQPASHPMSISHVIILLDKPTTVAPAFRQDSVPQ